MTLPNIFETGKRILADPMNENLAYLDNRIAESSLIVSMLDPTYGPVILPNLGINCTAAIAARMQYLFEHGGGTLFFPATSNEATNLITTYTCSDITLKSNCTIMGEHKYVKLMMPNNTNSYMIKTEDFDLCELHRGTAQGLPGVRGSWVKNISIDGNRDNNPTSPANVACINIYGMACGVDNIRVLRPRGRAVFIDFNGTHAGNSTDADIGPLEFEARNLITYLAGEEGYVINGPSDALHTTVVCIDSGQNAENTYSQIIFNTSARCVNVHPWTNQFAAARPRVGVEINAGGSSFTQSHFEGSRWANIWIKAGVEIDETCQIYALRCNPTSNAQGAANVILEGVVTDSIINCRIGPPATDGNGPLYPCVALRCNGWLSNSYITFGVSVSDTALIILGAGYSGGNNKFTLRGFSGSAATTLYSGNFNPTDCYDLVYNCNGTYKQAQGYPYAMQTNSITLNNNQTAATGVPSLEVKAVTHATSKFAEMKLGNWLVAQDITGTGSDTLTLFNSTFLFAFTKTGALIVDNLQPANGDGVGGFGYFNNEFHESHVEITYTAPPAYTTAQITDKTHQINTTDKRIGRWVYNSSTRVVLYASGSNATDAWYNGSGTLVITPV